MLRGLHQVILVKKGFAGTEKEGPLCGSTQVPVEACLGHLCALQETHNEVI